MSARAGRTPRRKAQSEQGLQTGLVRLLRLCLAPEVVLFAIPNGGYRARHEAAILIGQGVVTGMVDLMVLWAGRAFGMELKSETGRLSPAQVDVHAHLARAQVPVAVIRSAREAIDFLKSHNVPFRHEPQGV